MSTTVPLELIESRQKVSKKDIRARVRIARRAHVQRLVMWRIKRLERDRKKIRDGKCSDKTRRIAALDSKIQNLYSSIGNY